jgi:archaeal flagellin FlaB
MNKFNRFFRGLHREQKGITGLETAIILIAFVTVASVLAYSVLSAGIFSSEKGKETVYQGLSQASSTMQVRGDVLATATSTTTGTGASAVTTWNTNTVQFSLASVLQDAPVDMTPPTVDATSGLVTGGNVVVINYNDGTQHAENIPWTVTRQGGDITGNILSNNESVMVTVDLTKVKSVAADGTATAITAPAAYAQFTIQIVPPTGAAITITRSLPGSLSPVMDLH